MTHGSLFSGIGGFDLAAEWMGWDNIFHCEWNPFGQKVLKHYWPDAISYSDITKTDFSIHRGSIDILTGGFPCQPYSNAGKRLGTDDDRHLWPEMLRAIREVAPRWVIGENVRGLTNWNGGMVFNEVQTDLESQGYEVWPFLLPACAVNAPHRRDRIWFVACNTQHNGFHASEKRGNDQKPSQQAWTDAFRKSSGTDSIQSGNATDNNKRDREEIGFQAGREINVHSAERNGNAADCESQRVQRFGSVGQQKSKTHGKERLSVSDYTRNNWSDFPTQPPIRNGNDGFPAELVGITFSKWRNESIKAAGNAIVPQVALQIFKAIEQFEQL